MLWKSRKQTPGIISILMSAGTASSFAQSQQCRLHADLMLEPPLNSISLLDWQAYERTMEIGYRYTSELLEQPESRRQLGLES